jgi:hypothetical protein
MVVACALNTLYGILGLKRSQLHVPEPAPGTLLDNSNLQQLTCFDSSNNFSYPEQPMTPLQTVSLVMKNGQKLSLPYVLYESLYAMLIGIDVISC